MQYFCFVKKAIFTAGYIAVLHIHSVVEECEIVELIEEIDTKRKKDDSKKKKPKKPRFVKNGAVVVCRVQVRLISQTCIQKKILQFVYLILAKAL